MLKLPKNAIWLLSVFLLFLLISCQKEKKEGPSVKKEHPAPKAQISVSYPEFNADSAYSFIEKQLAFGYRIPGTEAHEKTGKWLESKMKSYGAQVQVQKGRGKMYNDKVIDLKNIIASINPSSKRRIVFFAHWDSRRFADHDPDPAKRKQPVPGANDGASGVAVLLEMLRIFSEKAVHNLGIDVVLVDAEDQGTPDNMGIKRKANSAESWGLGAQYWARNPHRNPGLFRYGILLDMVGAGGATYPKETFSLQYAPQVVEKVWSTASRLGYGNYFIDQTTQNGITDDHYFINTIAHIPTIDIIHYDLIRNSFYPYWHTTEDDLDKINRATLKATGSTLLEVVYREDITL